MIMIHHFDIEASSCWVVQTVFVQHFICTYFLEESINLVSPTITTDLLEPKNTFSAPKMRRLTLIRVTLYII